VAEERKLFSASTVFFRADSNSKHRRTASVGPGLTSHDISDRWLDDGTTGEYDEDDDDVQTLRSNSSFSARRGRRTLSVDSATHQRNYLSHQEERISTPTPPYPSPATSTLPSTSSLTARSLSSSSSRGSAEYRDQSPAQSLSDFRSALTAGIVTRSSSRHSLLSLPPDDHSPPTRASTHSPIIGNVPEENAVVVDISKPRNPSSPPSYRLPISNSTASGYPSPPPSPIRPRSSSRTPPTSIAERGRPRGTSRLRFGSILDAFKDVASKSPQRYTDSEDGERGRTRAKGRGTEGDNDTEPGTGMDDVKGGRGRSALGKISGLLGAEENKESGDGWKEFKPGAFPPSLIISPLVIQCIDLGVYTYPISFAIPGDSPPSITCTSGAITWRLKAEVHRPGVLTSKLSTTRDVTLVSMPGEDDSEETGHIHFDQLWESQLQYVISVAGKSFPIGGVMPIRFTLRPLAKIKIYRITLLLEGTPFSLSFDS
jgi:arrestin-related trafficking adapter 3/6